jgi:hypothetical protein
MPPDRDRITVEDFYGDEHAFMAKLALSKPS